MAFCPTFALTMVKNITKFKSLIQIRSLIIKPGGMYHDRFI